MNLKSLYNYGLPQTWGNGVDKNALFLIPRGPILPPPPTGTHVSPSAQTITSGNYKFCYVLDKTTDINGNVAVFYNNGAPIPIFEGAFSGNALVSGTPQWITDANGNNAILNAIVNITYDGNTDPPTGNPNTDTVVNVQAVMLSPAYVIFPGFTYTIKAKQAQYTYLTISAPASKTYDGTIFDFLQYVSTNSNASIAVSYSGVSGTKYGPTATPPKNVGNYSVSLSQAATADFGAASNSTTFSITQLTDISYFDFASLQAYYTGSALQTTCLTTPAGLAYTILYNGSSTHPTAIGSYTVKAQINDPNVSPNATNSVITNTFNIVKSNQIAATAANSTTIVRATYSSAINKFLVDFVGTYQ